MDTQTEMLLQKYYNVSREESEKIKRAALGDTAPFEYVYERALGMLHCEREKEKAEGRQSIIAGPLIHVISVQFQSHHREREPLSVYGRIYSEFSDNGKIVVHDLFNRNFNDAQVLGSTGSLTLTNPSGDLSWPWPCMSLHTTRLVVDVCVGGKACAGCICCEENSDDLEHVKRGYISNELGVLTLGYIAMPFGIYAHIRVRFFGGELDDRFLDVKGKIVARYCGEKCTLFDKNSDEFERVRFNSSERNLSLSRDWVGLPPYSSLIVDMDLSDFASGRQILKDTLEFRVRDGDVPYNAVFMVDNLRIHVDVKWFSPKPQGRYTEKEDEPCVPEALSNVTRPWQLGVHRSVPLPSALVEIFSIFIGREKFKALQVYGSVEVSSLASTVYFNKEATNAFELVEGSKTLPVLDGSLIYDDCEPLKLKVDLKDVGSCLHIRGYADWDTRTLEFGAPWLNKQLCSVVEGDHGFAAIHYSIFPEAVLANIGVLCTPKFNGNGHVDMFPKIHGSIVAQYNNFEYTSQYNRDYYRLVLFQRNPEDPAQTSGNGVLSLSRSIVGVPLNSSLVIQVNLWIGDDQVLLQSTSEFQIGANEINLKNNDYSLHIYVKWE